MSGTVNINQHTKDTLFVMYRLAVLDYSAEVQKVDAASMIVCVYVCV